MSVKKTADKKEIKEELTKKAAEPVAAAAPEKKPARKRPAKKSPAKSAKTAKKAKQAAAEAVEQAVTEAAVKETVKAAVAETVTEAAAEAVTEAAAEAVTETVTEAAAEAVTEAAGAVLEEAVAEAAVEETVQAAEEAVTEAAEEQAVEEVIEAVIENTEIEETVKEPELPQPRRSVAFIGSECYPFIKTGGLGDVMYALPKALIKQNCDVKVILPRYACIPQKYQEKMVYRGEFQMDLCSDGRSFYVGIMEYVCDGVVYDFIDNNDFFSWGNPYTDLVRDIPKYCYFAKAALAALNYMDWIPDIIHCHDWQAALVPVYLRTLFANSPVGRAKSVITIHNLRFQGVYNIPTLQYWTGLPGYVFGYGFMKQGYEDANMLKGGLAFADMITTVSNTYAWEIQTPFYGEGLDAHLRHHSGKLRGIVNGIDVDIWNSATDKLLAAPYDISNVLENKKANKRALQEALGLEQNDGKMVIGLISRLTDQKGLDLVNAIFQQLIDGNTQIVVLGTGDKRYEEAFRYYENTNRGTVCSYISYNEGLAHQIYAGADALLVPSLFEPCGLTQLIAMRYGTVPIVRETGGLKDTVQPYNAYSNEGNGFTFDRYEAGLLLDAINRAKTVYFTDRWHWDEMVQRNMAKDVSWENSARQYRELYLQLRP
jgi:starch synthase